LFEQRKEAMRSHVAEFKGFTRLLVALGGGLWVAIGSAADPGSLSDFAVHSHAHKGLLASSNSVIGEFGASIFIVSRKIMDSVL
jgi:hypothetical protein